MYSVSACRLYLELTLTDGQHALSSRPARDGGCEGEEPNEKMSRGRLLISQRYVPLIALSSRSSKCR